MNTSSLNVVLKAAEVFVLHRLEAVQQIFFRWPLRLNKWPWKFFPSILSGVFISEEAKQDAFLIWQPLSHPPWSNKLIYAQVHVQSCFVAQRHVNLKSTATY